MNIVKPTLLINESICKSNIRKMADKAGTNGLIFKPHFKTHQSHAVGRWFKEVGVEHITVSSLGMADYFSKDGWKNITVAFPCNIRQIDLINDLASRINLTVLVDNVKVIDLLSGQLNYDLGVKIELDSGKGRTGVNAKDLTIIDQLVSKVKSSEKLQFKGFYLHAGHSYGTRGKAETTKIYTEAVECLQPIKAAYPDAEICYGDTPTCSVIDKFESIDAMSPGNFVFYDIMQEQIASCSIEDVGVAVACPVVSINSQNNQVCIYGGGVHFAKDNIEVDGYNSFGQVVKILNEGWSAPLKGAYLKSVSQEHGLIYMPDEELSQWKVGDVIGILPVHSCMTADCLGEYYTFEGAVLDHYSKKMHAR
ncbi:alanine racemase [Fulvivirga sp.]|uniref:alanine racemase n=1 Tax=Fulvivirga sp. TaxID=1931237 RepID=UPI0032EE0C8B